MCSDIEKLTEERDILRAAIREAFEAWAGSELNWKAETAPEAYALWVINQMLEPLKEALGLNRDIK